MRLVTRYALCLLAASLTACPPASLPEKIERDASAKQPPPPPPARVVVVGGGLAGLSAAYELGKLGVPTHLLEASDVWGGRVQTANYEGGLNAEFGMQEMWEGNPLLDIARELKVELDGEPEEPFSSLLIDGKVVPYVQDSSKEFFASFLNKSEQKALESWFKSTKALREELEHQGLKSERVRKLQTISFMAWVQSQKLPPKVATFIKLILECELAATWDGFSALSGVHELGIFLGSGVPNFHVSGGNSKLIAAMAQAVQGQKTRSALVQGVRRIQAKDGKLSVEVDYLRDNVVHTLKAERVVLAVPFVRLHQINFDPPLTEDRLRAINTLGLGQYTVVHLIMDKAAAKTWEVDGKSPLPVLSDGPLGVIYGVQNESPADQDDMVFALLIYGMYARLFHMVPRDMKIKEILSGLEKLWPGFGAHVKASHVYTYHPGALPVWPPGRSPLDESAELLRQPELGAYFAGDYLLGSHSDAAVKSGLAAARAIAKELGE